MKKRIFLMLVMVAILVLTLALAVSAESVHSGKVDLSATVILDDGTELNLFDSEGNALIWYKNGTKLESIRADDTRVQYTYNWESNIGDSNVGLKMAYEFKAVTIALESGNIGAGNIVVFNIMDDDVTMVNSKGTVVPATCIKNAFAWSKNLEYAFLRLDTVAIQQTAFAGCAKLKYVNLENLTELRVIDNSENFKECTSLFAGQVLDLSKTKLIKIGGYSAFAGTKIAGFILPNSLTSISKYNFEKNTTLKEFTVPYGVKLLTNAQFNACTGLTTVYMSKNVTGIEQNVFADCTALKNVFFVGTKAELDALLLNVNATGNSIFTDMASNAISYKDYLALSDKSGSYVVYDYSYCEAYNGGKHELSGNTTMQAVDYFKGVFFTDTCNVTGCGIDVIDDSLTIGALFVDYGYSMTESAIGGKLSMTQFFGVNKENLEKYINLTEKAFEYGFVVSSNNDPLNEENSYLIAQGKTYVTSQDKFAHDYFAVTVVGFAEEGENANVDKALTFCVYVKDGDQVCYLDNGETAETVNMKSYNEIKALLNGNNTEVTE